MCGVCLPPGGEHPTKAEPRGRFNALRGAVGLGSARSLIFGMMPTEVFRFFVNHRCFSQEHLRTYPVVSCRSHTLLPGSLTSSEVKCCPVDCGTSGENFQTSLPLLRPYYASVPCHESRGAGQARLGLGIVATGKQCCADTVDCWPGRPGVQ